MTFSPDGSMLATVDDSGGPLRIWDLHTGKELRHFAGDENEFGQVAFSPDGRLLAEARRGHGGTIHIWDLCSGTEVAHFRADDNRVKSSFDSFSVSCLAFSADGRTLAVGTFEPGVQLWEVATGKRRHLLEGHLGLVWKVAFLRDGRRLVSGSKDTTALVWDLTGRLEGGKLRPANLSSQDLDALWMNLASEDATAAFRALWILVAGPKQSVPFLQEHLGPVASADPQRIAQWIADLDSKRFTVREQATAELEKLEELAEPALRQRLAEKPPDEVRRRIIQLLARVKATIPCGERLRTLRSIEALEQIGTPEARQALERLAKGATAARETQAAKASLQRLAKRRTP
jgi:hypothetical protein